MARPRIPSLNWLRVFETAARAESFARAAEALNMSAPAVSQQIRALEAALGRPLFERGPRAVRLTEAGRAFLPTVTNALASVETTAASLFSRADAAPLTVRCQLLFALGWLAPRLDRFAAAHPEVQLTLVSGIEREDFERRSTDLMITFDQPPQPGEVGTALFGERLYPVATPSLAATISAPRDLLDHPLIEVSTHRHSWSHILPAPLEHGSVPRITFTDSTASAFVMAAGGTVLALARAPASDALEAAYGLVRCLPNAEVMGAARYHLVHRSGDLTKAARAFRDWLLAEVDAENAAQSE